jgi:hypothetical protein
MVDEPADRSGAPAADIATKRTPQAAADTGEQGSVPYPVEQPNTPPVAAPVSAPEFASRLLVPHEVSRAKLARELDDWQANAATYRRRGWLLLDADLDTLTVDVAFLAAPAFGDRPLLTVTAAIRLNYDNYDLWPPSLTFIDARTGNPDQPPVQALERGEDGQPRNALLGLPGSGRPFLCLPGLREYHEHPQHTGDAWLLHRGSGEGRLAVICDRVWRRMVRNVAGLYIQLQMVPDMNHQLVVALAQADLDAPPAAGPDTALLQQPPAEPPHTSPPSGQGRQPRSQA